MTFWKGQNNEEIKKISGCQGLDRRKGEMNRQSTKKKKRIGRAQKFFMAGKIFCII